MRVSNPVKRAAAGTVVLVVAVASMLTGSVANAQPPPGTLFLTERVGSSTPKTSGIDTDVPGVVTSGPCPAAANAFNILLEGPGGLSMFATLRTLVGFSTTAPINSGFGLSFKDTAATDTPPVTLTAGTYTVTLQCVSGLGSTIQGRFVSTVVFSSPTAWTVTQGPIPTPTGTTVPPPTATVPPPTATVSPPTATVSPPTATPVPQPGATSTRTTLSVFPRSAFEGLPVVLVARVSPFNASGTVQFMDGDRNIGGPVRVIGGLALRITASLDEGRHRLTAEFTPTNAARYEPSSDSENLRVRSLFGSLFGSLFDLRF